MNACHEKWVNLHPLIRLLALAAVLGGVGLVAAKPSYRAFKVWRFEKNLTAARKAVKEERMDEARDFSLSVLQTGDPCIEAYRILEKSTLSLRDSRHGDVARALMSHPEGSVEDRLNGFNGIVMETPLGLVGQAWTTLPKECQKDPRFALAFAQRLIAEKRLGEAASVMLSVPDEARTVTLERRLISVLIASGKLEGYEEAQRRIATGLPAHGRDLPEWLELLEQIPVLCLQEQLLAPVRKLLEDPGQADQARSSLMLARMDYAAQYTRRSEVLDAAITRWKDPAPELLGRFLSQLGLNQLLLDTFPSERVGEVPGLFPLILDAQEETGAWDRVIPLLDEHGHLIPKEEELAHRAIVVAKISNSGGQAQAWAAAIEEAKTSPQSAALLKLQRMARNAGMQGEADLALLEAIRRGRGPLPLYEEIKPLLVSLQQQGRENTILEICAIYLQFEPGNPVLLTQYAYLACLNQLVEPATALKALIPLAEAFPKEVPIRLVLAAVYLCDGQNDKAGETLAALELDPAQLPPPYRMAVLATRILNHQMTKDDPLVTEFPWKALLPSERRKFSELVRKADL